MRKGERKRIEVWADWIGMENPQRLGTLYASPGRGREILAFEYDKEWLQSPNAQNLDPSLALYTGVQYAPEGAGSFNLFLDSSPDRWGRVLMDRREAQRAREEGRAVVPLRESDYLLGVYDGHRMGGLRFKTSADGPFLDDDHAYAAPPWTSLRELEHASLQLEKSGAETKPGYKKWLSMLMAPGASLGGARPKASVIDPKGALWIAKFPSKGDTYDVGAWEYLAHTLAKKAGLDVANVRLRTLASDHHTFLTQRFDRGARRSRIHFASAMTLLQRNDGDSGSDGASYLELAELIVRSGACPQRDLHELWTRIVFSICVSNVDDHLRNHGFLLTPQGWALSPMYDVNPNPLGDGLLLNISETDNAQSLDLALEVAPFFRLNAKQAKATINRVIKAVKAWPIEAKGIKIGKSEQARMAPAFRVAHATE
jgi:serine/threonine-protein kinase HipA